MRWPQVSAILGLQPLLETHQIFEVAITPWGELQDELKHEAP